MESKEWPVLIGTSSGSGIFFYSKGSVLEPDSDWIKCSRSAMIQWLNKLEVKQLEFIPKEFI